MGKTADPAAAAARSRALLARRYAQARHFEAQGHRRRCAALPRPADPPLCRGVPLPYLTEAEVQAMLAAYRARGGRDTACPEGYALPAHNGAGRDPARWTR